MSSPIVFGTSGHRGIIGEGFTAPQVRAVAFAVADYLKSLTPRPQVILGYDPRQGNDPERRVGSFTQVAVDTLLAQGIDVVFCPDYCPTPVISWSIVHYGLQGGLILTASHNPPMYNGIKFNPQNGAPAPSDVTTQIQDLANGYLHQAPSPVLMPGTLTILNPIPDFAKALATLVRAYVPTSFHAETLLAIDTKHGATASTWEALCHHLQVRPKFVHQEPSSTFEGIDTNPTQISSLTALRALVVEKWMMMGCSNDPDGDRHLVVDETGTPLTPEETALIIAQFFLDQGYPLSGIASTVASSAILRLFCEENRLAYFETAVGFKYFAPYFEAAQAAGTVVMGVESSGGFSLSSHTLEKCGFLPVLLVLGICQQTGISVSDWVKRIHDRYGDFYFLETSQTVSEAQKDTLRSYIQAPSAAVLQTFFAMPLDKVSTEDGLKLHFEADTAWVLLRLSGTEPVARVYVESRSEVTSQILLAGAQHLFLLPSSHLSAVFFVLVFAHFFTTFFN